MIEITINGFKIKAVPTGLNQTTIYIDDQEYDTWYGNHNEFSEYIRPLCDDIRDGFIPFVGWPEDGEDDKIFSEAIHWDGDPGDCQAEPVEYPEDIF